MIADVRPTREIDVAFGVDARFAVHAAAVIASVVHYAEGGKFRFILLHTGVAPDLQRLSTGARSGARRSSAKSPPARASARRKG